MFTSRWRAFASALVVLAGIQPQAPLSPPWQPSRKSAQRGRVKCPGAAQTAAAEQGSLQPMARRAPPARARQPPPLLMGSAACSTDTRCSALAGLVPGCRPSARPSARPLVWTNSLRYTHSRVPGPGSQAETMRSGLPSWKVSGYNRFHHFPHLRPIPGLGYPLYAAPQPGTPRLSSLPQHPENLPLRSVRNHLPPLASRRESLSIKAAESDPIPWEGS